jgi:hypothetical protein
MAQKPRTAALKVAATIEPDADGGLPKGEMAAYAYSAGGHLLHSAPLDKAGNAALKVPLPEQLMGVRIMVGPKLELPDLTELLRRGAFETHVVLDPRELNPIEIVIYPDDWLCWFRSRCTARGTVLKRTIHNGEPLDLPVCGAEVEIYEVDPIWIVISRLPDIEIERIRDQVLHRIPLPDPPPEIRQLAVQHLPAPEPLAFAAKSAGVAQLRKQLVLHPDFTRMILCWLQPRYVFTTLIGTATTDQCGHFRYTFYRGCSNPDQPDLYFRVLQPLYGGFRVPIYDPTPIQCNTYWDYACGTEITLYTSSPFAQTCSPCPPLDPGGVDRYVTVLKVGALLTSNIYGVSPDHPASSMSNDRGMTIEGAPFGGTLNPHLEFDPQLRDSLGVMYYRVTVQRPGGADPRELDTECFRHYTHSIPGGAVTEARKLGPNTVNGVPNLFEIPSSIAPLGVWSTPNSYEDEANAKWVSTMEAPGAADSQPDKSGKFELKIELFDTNGVAVNTAAKNIHWLVPKETTAVGAAVLHLVPPLPGCISGSAFLLPLHVDNNPSYAEIDAPLLNGSAAADVCGVMRYTPPTLPQTTAGSVDMPYRARHRNGFATYSFEVKRGVTPLTPPSTSGPVGPATFVPNQSVEDLLGPCTIAAFLEDLWVYGSATNGWSRVGYDDHASRAFALAPVDPPPPAP